MHRRGVGAQHTRKRQGAGFEWTFLGPKAAGASACCPLIRHLSHDRRSHR